jgi:flagellar biosynthesis anti-sigma factor FlgM
MKIDTYRSSFDPSSETERADSVKRAETAATDKASAGKQSDEVRLSPDAKLAAKALAVAGQPDEVRAERVHEAKKMLANGELGRDADRLAAAIIARIMTTG